MSRTQMELLRGVICNTEPKEQKAILKFLNSDQSERLNESAHGLEFNDGKGNVFEIIMWQPVEYWTLSQLIDHVV